MKNLMTQFWSFASPIWIALVYKVMCSGVFEVSLLRLNNNRGVNEYGRCCAGSRTTPPCTDQCQTYFSVCLMHSIQAMPANPTCTYGSSKTAVLGGNNLYFQEYNDTQTVKMQINFSWPGQFSMLLEAWHDTKSNTSTKDSGQLIIQSLISKILYPSTTWRGETTITPTTELRFKYRIRCTQHFYGIGCDVICRSRDDQFGHYTCNENGTKICKAGWNGSFCDQALCSEACIQNKGFCETPYECRCRLGWEGPDCSQCRLYNGCLHGYCYKPYQCICEDGWAGFLCDIDINYCSKSKPCLHGGTCNSDLSGNYTCLCTERYGGQNCQYALCYDGYCQNGGSCETRNLIRTCRCMADYYGNQCQYRKLTCDEVVCHNGGMCVTGENGGICECHPNSTGKFCESRLDACISMPCNNGGECVSTSDGYRCKCLPNYAGKDCKFEINPCKDFTCHNDGRCVVKIGSVKPTCDCPEQFTGDNCQIPLDPCYGVTCFNGGTCGLSPMGNGFICFCAGDYHGEFCEEEMNLCASSPCKNGAECKNYITSFLCICPRNFYGKYCELDVMLSDRTDEDEMNENSDIDGESSSPISIVNSTKITISNFLLNVISFLCCVLMTNAMFYMS